MRNSLTIALALLRVFKRNKVALFFTVGFPIALFVIVGFFTQGQSRMIEVAVISGSHEAQQQFVRQLGKIPALRIHLDEADAARQALADKKVAILVDLRALPDDASLDRPAQVPVTLSTALRGEATAGMTLMRAALADPSVRNSSFDFAVREDGSRSLPYLMFFLPGVIGFSIMQMCVFSIAQGQLQARQSGMLKGLLLTRMTGFDFVMGTAISRLLIAMFQAGAILLAAKLFFHVNAQGNPVALALVLMVGGLVFVGLGFVIASLATMQEAVNPIANAVMLPMFLLGGVFFPISALPAWLQGIAAHLPLSGFVGSLRQVITTQTLDAAFFGNMAVLACWAVLVVGTAAAALRWRAAYTD